MKSKKVSVTLPEQSATGTLNQSDVMKILKGAGIAFGGAFLFSVGTWAAASLQSSTFVWAVFARTFITSAVPAALSVAINAVIKFFAGQNSE